MHSELLLLISGPYRHGTMENFYSSYRQNCWSWGYHITDQEAEEIKKQIDSFYLNGGSIETAPLSLKVDVGLTLSSISNPVSYWNPLARNIFLLDTNWHIIFKHIRNTDRHHLSRSPFICVCLQIPIRRQCFHGQTYNWTTIERTTCRYWLFLSVQLEIYLQIAQSYILMLGTYHAEDFSYWAEIKTRRPCRTDTLTPKTRQMIDTFTNLISTFATTGYGLLHTETDYSIYFSLLG